MPANPETAVQREASYEAFETLIESRPQGFIRRFFATQRQFLGLIIGGGYDYVRTAKKDGYGGSLHIIFLRIILFFTWPFIDRDLAKQPFHVQFRRRLERLGPTYIKLGQILSLREDLLPKSITDELKNLLDRLPAVPIERFQELIENSLQQPVNTMFSYIAPLPLGSASLGQTHRATLVTGEEVVLKVLKPSVRQTVINDTRLLRILGNFTQLFLARYQPKRLIDEFCRYTLLEIDLRHEADNAETFTANFIDEPEVRFPKIYRQYSSRDVLCMEFFSGRKPSAELAAQLDPAERDKVIRLGVGATIQMIYRDGFFHADLHPGNLLLLDDGTVGFIDLGMVGRFDTDMRKRLLNYFYSLVEGDAASAARYLTSITIPGRNSDPDGFRRAVEDLNRRWLRSPNFDEFSLAQLILQSISLAGRYHIQYPGEIILMIKALVTLEGVGNLIAPGIDLVDTAGYHVRKLLFSQFNIRKMFKDSLILLPEIIDILNKSPLVIDEGLRYAENRLKSTTPAPFSDLKGTLFAGSCILGGAIIAAADGSTWLWGGLLLTGFVIALYGAFSN